jgi:polyphosphate kinase 2 (PPK2 family)
MAQQSLSSFFTCPRTNSASAFSRESISRKKNWKFSDSDLKEREFWKDYQRAYAECLSHTSSEVAPWYIVPADDKLNCRLIVSQIILNAFEGLKLSYPTVGAQRRRELRSLRRKLSGTE